jgi:hypothetical protein
VAAARICSRVKSESEATPAIAAVLAADALPWPGAVAVDATAALPDTVAGAVNGWHGDLAAAGYPLTGPTEPPSGRDNMG